MSIINASFLLILVALATQVNVFAQALYEEPVPIRGHEDKPVRSYTPLISLVPYKELGKIIGYKINPEKIGLHANLGIQHDDIVLKINGFHLSNIRNMKAIARSIRGLTEDEDIKLELL